MRMNRRWMCLAIVIWLGTPIARAQNEPCGPSTQVGYQNSADDLQRLLNDIVTALKRKDEKQALALAETLLIPDPIPCFSKLFGQPEGDRVAAMYRKLRDFDDDPIPGTLRSAAKEKNPNVGVERVENGPEANLSKLEEIVLRAMQSPATLYDANYEETNGKNVWALGYYIHTGGGFRRVDSTVLSALSTAPPLRIRVGGNVQQARLIYKPHPRYPETARAAGTQGTVRMKVVIGTDGLIKELEVVSGPSELVDASVEAVRQWRYKPTFLNGLPVEVVSTIDIVYTLGY